MAAKPRAVRYSGTPMARPGGPPITVPRPAAHPKPARHPKPMTPAQLRALKAWEKKHPFKGGFKPKAKPKAKPKRAAPFGLMPSGGEWVYGYNDTEPTCVATAIANSLLAVTGIRATEEQVMKLHRHAGGGDGVSISDALASVVVNGLSGVRPAGYWVVSCMDEGSIVGMTDGVSDHAVAQTPSGLLISWGAPLDPELAEGWFEDGEIWHIDWLGGGS